MKKLIFLFFVAAMFACESDYPLHYLLVDDGTRNSDGSLTVSGKIPGAGKYDDITAIAPYAVSYGKLHEGKYDDGKFIVTLPAQLDEDQIGRTISEYFGGENISFSDTDTKITRVEYYELFDKNGYNVTLGGSFRGYPVMLYLRGEERDADKLSGKMVRVAWLYVDGDVSVNGTNTTTYPDASYVNYYNMNLKRGWNVVYNYRTYNYDEDYYCRYKTYFTTAKPKMPMDWVILVLEI